MHDCNATIVNDLVNFDKLRLLASIIRFMDAFRYVRYDQLNDVRLPYHARPLRARAPTGRLTTAPRTCAHDGTRRRWARC